MRLTILLGCFVAAGFACAGGGAVRAPPVADPPSEERQERLPPPPDEPREVPCPDILRSARIDPTADWLKTMDSLLAELSTTSFPDTPGLHAACLCVLAEAFADGSAEAGEIRHQAGLIAGASDVSLRQAMRLKHGLEAVLRVAEQHASRSGADVSRSLRVATNAVGRIDAHSPVAFQRAATHDALRTVVTLLGQLETAARQ